METLSRPALRTGETHVKTDWQPCQGQLIIPTSDTFHFAFSQRSGLPLHQESILPQHHTLNVSQSPLPPHERTAPGSWREEHFSGQGTQDLHWGAASPQSVSAKGGLQILGRLFTHYAVSCSASQRSCLSWLPVKWPIWWF